ncbi:MAG: PAS domain S-box protein [Methanoregulaceae archaeon]
MSALLYVDDESNLLTIAKHFLEAAGEFTVVTSTSASEAIQLLQEQEFDAIISDYEMPGMDGIAFLKEVRSRFQDIPFILFTGRGREEVVIEAINNGVDFYLQKGGDPRAQFAELMHKAHQAIARTRAERALKRSEETLRSGEDYLKAIFEGVPAGILVVDAITHQIVDVNAAALQKIGALKENVVGRICHRFICPSEKGKCPITDLNQRLDNSERVLLTAEGLEVPIIKNVVPITLRGRHCLLETFIDITRRKQAESELRGAYERIAAAEEELRTQYDALARGEQRVRESEVMFRSIFENSPYPIAISNATEGTYTAVNSAFLRQSGYLEAEILGKNSGELGFVTLEERDRLFALHREKGRILNEQVTAVMKGGRKIPLLVSSIPLVLQEQAVVLTIFVDITDTRRAQDELRSAYEQLAAAEEELRSQYEELARNQQKIQESEERYRVLTDIAFDGIIIQDFSGKILFINHAIRQMLGAPDSSLIIGRNVMEFVAPESQETVVQDLKNVLSGKGGYLQRYRARDRMGNDLYLESIGTKIEYQGQPANIVALRDITEQVKAEQELRESEQRNRLILQSANDAIYIHEISREGPGRLIEVNDQACQMLGYTREELMQMRIPDLDVPDQRLNILDIQNQLFSTGRAVFQTEHLTRDRRRLPVEVSDRLVDLKGRKVVLSIVRDLSEQKRAEQALKATNRKLNLLNSITRHDVANQLMALEGYMGIALMKRPDPVIQEYLKKIEVISHTISRQIAFTKTYQNLGTTDPQWQEIRTLLPESEVPCEVKLVTDLQDVMIYADPILKNVFLNFLDNSLRHGEHVTSIRVSAEESPNGLHILWEDDGVGIPFGEKEKIFSQGYGKNTGLGLFISREILSLTNISIREVGEPGKGVRFEINVPNGAYRFREKKSATQ